MKGEFGFGFWDPESLRAIVLDPTLGSISLQLKSWSFEQLTYTPVKEIEMTPFSKDTHPEYFYEGSLVTNMIDINGFYSAKDFYDIVV